MAKDLLVALKAAEILQNHVQQIGGEEELSTEIERPRYQLLGVACAGGDLFFIALHQIFCCWSYKNSIARKYFLP